MLWCVLARRAARRCHIAWSHRLSAAVILSLARASTLEATCSSEGGHEPRHVLANPAISMSANVYLGLRKTLQFCPPTNINQKPAPDCTSQVQVEVDVCCGRYCRACNTLFHWKPLPPCRGAWGFSLMICRPECCDLSTRSFPSRPVRPVPSCPVRAVPSACSGRRPDFEPLR